MSAAALSVCIYVYVKKKNRLMSARERVAKLQWNHEGLAPETAEERDDHESGPCGTSGYYAATFPRILSPLQAACHHMTEEVNSYDAHRARSFDLIAM